MQVICKDETMNAIKHYHIALNNQAKGIESKNQRVNTTSFNIAITTVPQKPSSKK